MPTIEVSEETLNKLKEQFKDEFTQVELDSLDDLIGQSWFFRTVTYHLIGKVKKRFGNILVLEQASWVADSGRFTNAIKDGTLNEVEPLGTWNVNMASVTDFGEWKHALPTKQK